MSDNNLTASTIDRDVEAVLSCAESAASRVHWSQPALDPRCRRLERAQCGRRRLEQRARCRAVRHAQAGREQGWSAEQAAQLIGVPLRTLREWACRDERMIPCRGRQPLECSAATRNEVIRFLHHVSGPAVGLAALRALFRDLPRCILEDLLRRYRKMWRWRYRRKGFRLTWQRAGTVWAMDFSEPSQPIDGVYPYLFAVRDLASHWQLAWLPVPNQTADVVRTALTELFRQFGPPLVIKCDNGSAFIALAIFEWLTSLGMVLLYSPPHLPQYNGGLERSNGTLKTYTGLHATRAGHPFQWTCEDVEQARQLANRLSRPWGPRGTSPEEAWDQRPVIELEERLLFLVAVERQRIEARRDLGIDEKVDLPHKDRSRVDRLAISRVLTELNYLKLTRTSRSADKGQRSTRAELQRRAQEKADLVASTNILHERTPTWGEPACVPLLPLPTVASPEPCVPSHPAGLVADETNTSESTPATGSTAVLNVADETPVSESAMGKWILIAVAIQVFRLLKAQRDDTADLVLDGDFGDTLAIADVDASNATHADLIHGHDAKTLAHSATEPRGSPRDELGTNESPVDAPKFSLVMLASSATMRERMGASEISIEACSASLPDHVDRDHISWPRRLITLLIRLVKVANFLQ